MAFQNHPDRSPAQSRWRTVRGAANASPAIRFSFFRTPTSPPTSFVRCARRVADFNSKRALPVVAVDEVLYRRARLRHCDGGQAREPPIRGAQWRPVLVWPTGTPTRLASGLVTPAWDNASKRPSRRTSSSKTNFISFLALSNHGGPVRNRGRCAACEHDGDGRRTRPKVVASTATVRRAAQRVRALFARPGVQIFPSPGPDRRDSFFAKTVPSSAANAGSTLASPPRPKPESRDASELPRPAREMRRLAKQGRRSRSDNPVDPYMTLLGCFNALRELGGSRRIIEEEVRGDCPRIAIGGESARTLPVRCPGTGARCRRTDVARTHAPSVRDEASSESGLLEGRRPGCRDRHQHDLGGPGHSAPRPHGGARPAANDV